MYIELTANRYHSVNRESKTISNNKSGLVREKSSKNEMNPSKK